MSSIIDIELGHWMLVGSSHMGVNNDVDNLVVFIVYQDTGRFLDSVASRGASAMVGVVPTRARVIMRICMENGEGES